MNKRQTNGLAKALKEWIAVLEYGNEVHAFCEDRRIDDEYKEGVEQHVNAAVSSGDLRDVAEAVLLGAKARCPVDTESLKESGKIVETDTGYSVIFGSGINKETGDPIDYATYVHEIGYYRHYIGQAKYLEDAVVEVQSLLLSQGTEIRFGISYDQDYGMSTGCMICHIGGGKVGKDINRLEHRYASIVKSKSFADDTAYAKEISMRGSNFGKRREDK